MITPSPPAVARAAFRLQQTNPNANEFVGMPGGGPFDSSWREIAGSPAEASFVTNFKDDKSASQRLSASPLNPEHRDCVGKALQLPFAKRDETPSVVLAEFPHKPRDDNIVRLGLAAEAEGELHGRSEQVVMVLERVPAWTPIRTLRLSEACAL